MSHPSGVELGPGQRLTRRLLPDGTWHATVTDIATGAAVRTLTGAEVSPALRRTTARERDAAAAEPVVDEAHDAFLDYSERHGCRYHPRPIGRHQAELRKAVEAVARKAARELGIDTPQVRWFYDSNVRWSGEPLELRGLAFVMLNAFYVNLDVPLSEARAVTAHEVAHLAGRASEDEADAYALQFLSEHYPTELTRGGTPKVGDQPDEIVWWGTRAAWSGQDFRNVPHVPADD